MKLTTFLSKGLLKSIHIPDPDQIELQQIFRTRGQFMRDKKRALNRLKSLLIQHKVCFDEPRLTNKLIHFLSNLDVGDTTQLLVKSYWAMQLTPAPNRYSIFWYDEALSCQHNGFDGDVSDGGVMLGISKQGTLAWGGGITA